MAVHSMDEVDTFKVIGRMVLTDAERKLFHREMFPISRPPIPALQDIRGSDWTLRDPEETRRIARMAPLVRSDVNEWHKDSGGYRSLILVWSNIYPTELLLPDGTIVAGRSNDLVVFNNSSVQHRTPKGFQEAVKAGKRPNRYFLRASDVKEW